MRVLVLLLTMACGEAEKSSLVGDADIGEGLYVTNCSGCHGADATGSGDFPSLIDGPFAVSGLSDDALIDVIMNGIPGTSMPGLISDEQEATDITAYLRTL